VIAPDIEEVARRRAGVAALGLPYLAAEDDGAVIGFAYAGLFRPRPGYRFTVEDSVYVAPGAQGRGVGKALLRTVIAQCEALGMRRMLAVIGDSSNTASIALHRACGFGGEAVLPGVGWQFGRWLDLVVLHRALGEGDATPPDGEGLRL
jgi:phosphinothricin acetyltransferase